MRDGKKKGLGHHSHRAPTKSQREENDQPRRKGWQGTCNAEMWHKRVSRDTAVCRKKQAPDQGDRALPNEDSITAPPESA
jgi:hypothetical protein